jgi:ABC-type transporter Mla maintaining outer membrane lipid asymmetry permease subunit MlaE
MSTSVVTIVSYGANLPAALGPDLAAAIDLAKAEKAASTRKAYGTCSRRGAMPRAPRLYRRPPNFQRAMQLMGADALLIPLIRTAPIGVLNEFQCYLCDRQPGSFDSTMRIRPLLVGVQLGPA